MTEREKKEVVRLRKNGLSFGMIAKKTGLAPTTIKSFLKRNADAVSAEPIRNLSLSGTCRRCGAAIYSIFARSWDMLHITCMNRFDESTLHMKGTHFLSSKRSEQHGIGLRSVRSSVEKAQGNVSFSAKDGIFTAKIILPYVSF